jgi:hypothetical protein
MSESNRREFLVEVGQGMLVALIGQGLATDMGLANRAMADESAKKTPDGMERLIAMLQETPPDKLMSTLVNQLGNGTTLRELVAAGALANARAFGGRDYDGYHTFMALAPSYAMAQELPEKQRALPVFKVLHRNSRTMGSGPGRHVNQLGEVKPAEIKGEKPVGQQLVELTRAKRIGEADQLLVADINRSLDDAYNDMQTMVQDEVNVHRVVLAWRSWETLDFTGKDHARTLLRQSVHFCCNESGNPNSPIRTVLPKLMEKHGLMAKKPGTKEGDDAWMEGLSKTVSFANREQAAGAVAEALSEGYSPAVVGEAISLACARLVLGDPGRASNDGPAKPIGSVHGDSVGVHASDSANAWRHIAKVSNARNTFASLIAGAYHTAGQNGRQLKELYPQAADLEKVREKDPAILLKRTAEAIQAKDQRLTAALAQTYGQQGHDARPLFALLLDFAINNDGALHAEKYYRTVSEEFSTMRKKFRWQHLVALARVTASLAGRPAPGLEEARKLLG